MPTFAIYVCRAVNHPMPDRVKPSFVIFDIRALCRSALSVRVPGCQKLQMTAWPGLAHDASQLYPYGNSGCQRAMMRRVVAYVQWWGACWWRRWRRRWRPHTHTRRCLLYQGWTPSSCRRCTSSSVSSGKVRRPQHIIRSYSSTVRHRNSPTTSFVILYYRIASYDTFQHLDDVIHNGALHAISHFQQVAVPRKLFM